MGYAQLKERHRAERGAWHPNLSLRVHQALSWLDRADAARRGKEALRGAGLDRVSEEHPGAARQSVRVRGFLEVAERDTAGVGMESELRGRQQGRAKAFRFLQRRGGAMQQLVAKMGRVNIGNSEVSLQRLETSEFAASRVPVMTCSHAGPIAARRYGDHQCAAALG